jgi:DNA-binding response OmpR family regulator
MHTLIADPSPSLRDCYRRFLSSQGHEVETACQVEDCLGKLLRSPPAILILDQDLPWGGAEKVLLALREAWSGENPVAVILTDAGVAGTPDGNFRAPVVAHLSKPFPLSTLQDVIDQVTVPAEGLGI